MADATECTGEEINVGTAPNVNICAEKCKSKKVSMFVYGAHNEFRDSDGETMSKCDAYGCNCYCEVSDAFIKRPLKYDNASIKCPLKYSDTIIKRSLK